MATQISPDSAMSSQIKEFSSPQNDSLKQGKITAIDALVVEETNRSQVLVTDKAKADIEEDVLAKELKHKNALSIDDKQLDESIEIISDFMNLSTKNVNFQKDDDSDRTVIKVFDAKTQELIKQFPSEEVLEIAQKIVELRQDLGAKTGILLDEKV